MNYIVHLSDLHICDIEDPACERLKSSLIEDLNRVLKSESIIPDAIVVTGDIVDKGGSERAYNHALNFFEDLLSALNLDPSRLLFVPGNHDIPRRSAIQSQLNNMTDEDYNLKQQFEENWETLNVRFKKYNDFISKFSSENTNYDVFGGVIKTIETDNGRINAILLNSVWGTTGETDYKNIRIGRWQLEGLKLKYDEAQNAKLTIALMHHPIDWLIDKEFVSKFLSESRCMPVDAILHGHIHNGGLDINVNPDTSQLCLVSGIGYPDIKDRIKGQPKLSQCRYAIYKFNMENNLLDVYCRITREDGTFAADTLLYSAGSEDGHFSIPINYHKNHQINKPEIQNIEVDPVQIVNEWVGRENEIKLLLDNNLRLVAITGVGGQGKTALASEFLRRYARGPNSHFAAGVWVDCREIPESLHTKVIQLLEALSFGKETAALYKDERIGDTAKRFLKYLQSAKLLIVFDNIDPYIKADTESASSELKPILDVILNNEHHSLVIFTCRPSINDPRGSFLHIQLTGLEAINGPDFFCKRKIDLIGENEEKYCIRIVELTNGHPWWLGLIAGQVVSKSDTLKKCIEKISIGDTPTRIRIREYFSDIWENLNKDRKKMLRYLVESPHPLTENQINDIIEDSNPYKNQKSIRGLERAGLLEKHERTELDIVEYQVHPLVREFIHESYKPEVQQNYVIRVLYLFLPRQFANTLFSNMSDLDKCGIERMTPRDLNDSIETCLNSRNEIQALALLERYQSIIIDGGYHHQFIYLTCRTINSINWEKLGIVKNVKSAFLLGNLIEMLILIGDELKSNIYLRKYKSLVEPGTLHYLGYLSVASNAFWRMGKYRDALHMLDIFDQLKMKFNTTDWDFWANIRALSLRDVGEYDKAIELFLKCNSNYGIETTYGNIASCLVKLEKYDEAEELLRQSLKILLRHKKFESKTNLGHAYVWLTELMIAQGKQKEAKAFFILANEVWTDYAPGLLSRIDHIKNNFIRGIEYKLMTTHEARAIEIKFLNEKKDLPEQWSNLIIKDVG